MILKKGDEVKFKARLLTLGNEVKMHHLHLIEIEATGGHTDIPHELILREGS